MTNEQKLLRDILKKLQNIELLIKIYCRDVIDKFQDEIKKDHISKKILDLADGTLSYSELTKKVAQSEDVAEITVKKKISNLKRNGFLFTKREGNIVYYEKSELFD
ncbi:MAG: hypothetical protein ACTSQP_21495 [Promethearchaeota archaeon]